MGDLPRGTTAMAVITVDGVHLLSDTRQVITPIHFPHICLVTSEKHDKLYDIGGGMVATAAGTTNIILKFLDVVKVAVNNVSVDPYFAATVLLLSINQWMFENPGSESPAEFIIGSCHGGQCLIFKVQSSSLGGIEEEKRVGYPVFIGSGSNYASSIYCSNLLGIDPISLAEACIVTAALKCPSTGGYVKRVRVPSS